MMDFTGTYELQSHENMEAFLRAMGVPENVIEKGKNAKGVTEIKQHGNHFVINMATGPKVQHLEFNLGEETEVEVPTGEKVKSTMNLEDGKLVTKFKGVTTVMELSGDTLTSELTFKDIVCKRISKRIS
ncbi:fatty acid-binding protein, liver-like [Hyperolius riggenbachi]|uniref:fatty acid-binding protein, liver-like n=1 Tax=Hyperolius riggenbachi TaxID=752182 RepID=UPI0035A371F6